MVSAPLHDKLYSISYWLFGPLFGYNVLSAEPLNLLYYLAIVALVFNLGRQLSNERAAFLAAAAVALWPSFLLHTTQLLKDPPFITGMLGLVLISAGWLTNTYSWRRSGLIAASGGAIAIILWAGRHAMWSLVLMVPVLGLAFTIARQLHDKRFSGPNLTGAILVVLFAATVPRIAPTPHDYLKPALIKQFAGDQDLYPLVDFEKGLLVNYKLKQKPVKTIRDKMLRSLAATRLILIMDHDGSNIDEAVQFNSVADVLRYVPRAFVIGLWAPFPNMWFSAGKNVGREGRLLSGLETLAMYGMELLALFVLWASPRRLPVWLLVAIAVTGATALGLPALNVGMLYRLRYFFWILLIIVGSDGAVRIVDMAKLGKTENVSPA